ncbi:na+ dependent nucleoside transporter family protein, partial [Vibrio parahaemolyticus AQ3810]
SRFLVVHFKKRLVLLVRNQCQQQLTSS